jgi:hypothetical protein
MNKKVIEKLHEYGLSSYAFEKWGERGDYKELFGFLTAMQSIAITKYDTEAEKLFEEEAKRALNMAYNKEDN